MHTLVYNYCQWWQRYKSQIIDSKTYMVEITQHKQVTLWLLWKYEKISKLNRRLVKTVEKVRQLGNKNKIN